MNEVDTYHKLYDAGVELCGATYTPAEVTKFIRNVINFPHIKFKTHKTNEVDVNSIVVSGEYDVDADEEGVSSITVTLSYNECQHTICIQDLDWKKVCIDVIEVLGHEMVHQQQSRTREFDGADIVFISGNKNKETRERQEYLGQQDEVEAYGYSIALTAYLQGSTSDITGAVVIQNDMFKEYVTIFGTYHPVVMSLFEYIIQYHSLLCGDTVPDDKKQLAHLIKRF